MLETTTIGLNNAQVVKNRILYGANVFIQEQTDHFWNVLKKGITEPTVFAMSALSINSLLYVFL